MKEQQHIPHVKIITQCPTEPCAVFYTDTLSRSLLVVCKNPKHTDSDPADTDIKKLGSGVNGDQPNSDADLLEDTSSQFTDPSLQRSSKND